ncbi:MAG: hypothetical protein ACRDL7_13870, partial [Gaiellaceae bacterium]
NLNMHEKEQFRELLRRLCVSRQSIREAMAFCFDNSIAALEICDLKDMVMDSNKGNASIDLRIALL